MSVCLTLPPKIRFEGWAYSSADGIGIDNIKMIGCDFHLPGMVNGCFLSNNLNLKLIFFFLSAGGV